MKAVSKKELFLIAWSIYKKGEVTFSTALRIAWRITKGSICFRKKSGEVTERKVKSLTSVGYISLGSPRTIAQQRLIKAVDMAKYEAGEGLERSVISFLPESVIF